MEIKELRKKSKSELTKLLQEAGEGLIKLRAERKIGSLADGSAIGKRRAEIARVLTVLREQEILEGVDKAAGVKKPSSEGKKDAKKKT